MSYKLLSLNVEQDKHLEKVRNFVELENADAVALMEVCEDNLDTLLTNYPYRYFAANFHMDSRKVGVVVAAKNPFLSNQHFYADGVNNENIPPHGMGTHRPVMVQVEIETGEKRLHLGAIHFTWTPEMSETVKQHQDLDRLMRELGEKEIVLTGDFNIPRGNGAYRKLSARFENNIPTKVVTTIDPILHRANSVQRDSLKVVVDYVWSTPKYRVSAVKVTAGVSDHCGITGNIDIV